MENESIFVDCDEMADMDCGQVDHTEGAELGPIGHTFPSVRGPSYLAFQKGLHLWGAGCHEIT